MTEISASYSELLERLKEVEVLGEVMGILSWDQETMMPKGANDARGLQKSLLSGMLHEKFTDKIFADLITRIRSELKSKNITDQIIEANLREFSRSYNRQTKVPKDLVEQISLVETQAHAAWVEAREKDQFALFAPFLEKLVALKKKESHCIDAARSPYDVQLEGYEVGLNSDTIAKIFSPLKDGLIDLIRKISSSKSKPNTEILKGRFDISKQKEFCQDIAGSLGFNSDCGRMDQSVHPFCGGGGMTDVRITTRFNEDDFLSCLFAVIHETGHALYEQGLPKNLRYQPICSARSMAVHESQSLLWEKQVGLSREFWTYYLPRAKETFDPALRNASLDDFMFAISEVAASFIRVDADEVTYPLHVILRFEIEKDLFEGKIEVSDIPQIWNKRMHEYLRITPATNRDGCLQDVHWSLGLFGYFPTYNLGAIYASQIFHAIERDNPKIKDDFSKNQFAPLRKWLRVNLHEKGSILETPALILEITGQALDAEIHLKRLQKKYGDYYGV